MKNLIKDILTHLKENDEARERFNENTDYFDFYMGGLHHKIKGYGFYIDQEDDYKKQLFLLHALSSPNGKPICGFLEVKRMVGYTFGMEIINHASTLFNLLTSQIEKGKSFDEILIKLNKKYNELFE